MRKIFLLSFISLLHFSFIISQSTSSLPPISAESISTNTINRIDSLNMGLVGMWNYGYPFAIHTTNDYLYLGSGGAVITYDMSDTTNPKQRGNISFPGAYVRGIYVLDTLMFVADQERGFRIANVSDPSNPFEVGHYEAHWVHGVFARNHLAYTTEFNGDSSELVIYDVSDPQSPHILSKDTLPASQIGEVLVKDGYAYVTNAWGGLRIIDVSDSTSPFETGYYIPSGHTNCLSLYCDTLLLLGSYTTMYCGQGGLWLINIKDPYDPYQMGCDTNFFGGVDVSYFSHYAYVSSDHEGIKVIDFVDPSNPYIIGEFLPSGYVRSAVNTNIGSYIYAGEYWDNGFRTIDASDPAQPVTIDFDPIPDQCIDVAIKGNFAYVANSYAGIYVLDVSDLSNPKEIFHYDTPCRSNSVVVKDSIAYIADSTSILLLNISNPSKPEEISELPLICDDYGLELNYPYLYVTSGSEHYFAIVDVSNPQSPFVTGICYLDDNAPTYICHKDTFAYVSAPLQGVAVINIKDVYNPTLETYCPLPGYSRGLDYRENYLYVANFDTNIINIVDISDPTTPVLVDSFFTVREYPFELTIKDSFLYVALQIAGVEVFDISSPLAPNSVGYHCGPPLSIPLGIEISNDLVYLAVDNGIFIFEYTGGSGIEEKEVSSSPSFRLLQNPIRGNNINIQLLNWSNSNANLCLYNLLGQRIKTFKFESISRGKNQLNLNIGRIPCGVYFLSVENIPSIKPIKVTVIK